MTIIDQMDLIKRANCFVDKYGISRRWLASKIQIPEKKLSEFLNIRLALSRNQEDRLASFMNEYENCLNGFIKS